MIEFETFKEEMNWNTGDWITEQLETINNTVNCTNYTTVKQLEEEYDDSDVEKFIDVSLVALISNLTYNGMSSTDIVQYANALYGNIIDFYYF